MKSVEELRDQQNKASVELLFTDAEVALTMIDLARVSANSELKERRLEEASKAYEFILRHITTVSLSPQERVRLNQKLSLLKNRLMFF